MTKTLHYLFDPLCGWCYGAGGTVAELAALPGVALRLLPSGLFSGEGARPMSADFADYAWSNDQRIERLTGQPSRSSTAATCWATTGRCSTAAPPPSH
ncbi:hypothetical protein [Paracidovorax avenae]|uniref:hypothetical protein n=1 Tax=Paracidovorax avenae TaxID=80867 RepID=UPI0001BF2B3C